MLIIRNFGYSDYTACWHAMKSFTDKRDAHTPDEYWVTEHLSVYTQGQAGLDHHILSTLPAPLVQSDRGGQITYHGPGQWIVYFMIDLKRKHLSPKKLIDTIQNGVVLFLKELDIPGHLIANSPGVYVLGKKIASVALRVRNNCTYHGIALNANMNISAFDHIRPCGLEGMQMTQLQDWLEMDTILASKQRLIQHLAQYLGYNDCIFTEDELPNDNK
jgi:lipoyl(octanoyl) transferase